MQNVKENYTVGIGIILIIYLMWRTNHIYEDCIYDHILINFILFCMWYIFFNYRSFVMTRNRLSGYYHASILEYKALLVKGLMKDIYVRVKDYDDWYKLDYSLTIRKDSGYNVYEDFVSKNITVDDLLTTMNKNAESLVCGNRYKLMKSDYKIFKYMSLIFLLIFEFLYWMIYSQTNAIIY